MGAAAEGDQQERNSWQTADTAPPPPHVLVFPFPIQGHITPMLKLAELFSLSAIRVTFLCTDHNHRRLLRFSAVRDRLARRPGLLHIRSFPDGLPEDNPRDADRLAELHESLAATWPSMLRELVLGGVDPDWPPPTCVVADGLIGFAVDVAEELGVPFIAFRTSSASSFLAYQCIPQLIATGMIPCQDGCDMDELVGCVPGMESFLRRRDLPRLCRINDLDDPMLRWLHGVIQNATRCRGLVLHTTELADSTVLAHIRALIPSTLYPIGPLHGLLRTVLRLEHPVSCADHAVQEGDDGAASSSSSNSAACSLWHEERACIEWLGTRPPASVVYVSFGSVALLKRDQLLELWHGLVNSGYHFLLAARPGLVVVGDEDGEGGGVPGEVAEATKERGCLVGWAPQQEVLAHPAVGCFLTHGGWNSTLESMWAGVPMVCWPHLFDQHINSRFVSEVWGIGVDIKDTCDRVAVEKAVREVMAGESSSRVREAAAGISKVLKEAVAEGGSSYGNLERLVRDIRSMSLERVLH